MFVRVSSVKGLRYLQVVESYRKGGMSRHRVLLYLGRCDDEGRERMVRDLIGEYRPLSRARVVIAELEEVSGRIQGKGYLKRLRSLR